MYGYYQINDLYFIEAKIKNRLFLIKQWLKKGIFVYAIYFGHLFQIRDFAKV